MPQSNIDSSCSGRREEIEKQHQEIEKRLMDAKGRWGDLPPELIQRMLKSLRSTPIRCRAATDEFCQGGIEGRVKDGSIYLCPRSDESTLLHELVHDAGGEELDAEAIENHLYITDDTPPDGSDYDKFFGQDRPCRYFEPDDKKRKKPLVVSKFVIWNPRTGDLWVQAGTRSAPKKGKQLKATFPASSDRIRAFNENPPPECGTETAKKCGARCADFATYGFCDRKTLHPPCYQHRNHTKASPPRRCPCC